MSIDIIRELGDDALTNLFDMSIGVIADVPGINTDTLLRIQNFEIPETGANTYEVHYKTQVMTKVGGKINAPNEFSFNFRIDRNWVIYRAFVAWKNLVANSSTGVIMDDGSANPLRVEVGVWAVDSSGDKISNGFGEWQFDGCFVQSVSGVSFDYTSGEPIMGSVTMGFAKMKDMLP